jgi:hypothetical protein
MQSETPSSGYIGNVAANMPRVPVHREPKPPPHRRSHEQHDAHRRSRDYDHHVENGHAHNNRSHEERPNGKPKHQISTLTAHFVAAVGEFVGTFMFLFFSFIGQIMIVNQAAERSILNGQSSSQQNIFTALLYGFSLLVNVWAFYRISGGLFNPAVCAPTYEPQMCSSNGFLGNFRLGPGRRCTSNPITLSLPSSAHSSYVCSWCSSGHSPW